MRRTRIALLASLMVAAPFVACGLEEGGFNGGDGPPDGNVLPDVFVPDTSVDGSPDAARDTGTDTAAPDPCAGATLCKDIPSGWTPIGYLENTATACPTGFEAQARITGTFGGGRCDCGTTCTVTGTRCPDDHLSSVQWDTSGSATCQSPSSPVRIDISGQPGGCANFGSLIGMRHFEATSPATAARCSFPSVPNATNVTSKSIKICTSESPTCLGQVCAKEGFCIRRSGQQSSCPRGFGGLRVIGSKVSVQCSAATCGCDYSTTCTGVATLYPGGNCSGTGATATVNGECNPVVNGNYAALRYTASSGADTCVRDSTPAPQPNYQLTQDVETVCCKDDD